MGHPRRGLVMPSKFIQVAAQQSGLPKRPLSSDNDVRELVEEAAPGS
jgi:hypothetical protein